MYKEGRKLWLIDASYLFNAQESPGEGFRFDYLKLRNKLEEYGPIWRAYYLNATRGTEDAYQENFHNWLRSALPTGPKFITKIYGLRSINASSAYCRDCGMSVRLSCPNHKRGSVQHNIGREQQKGVDVGLATLALKLLDDYTTLLFSSGDGDLTDTMEYITEQKGKILELAVFRSGVSTELQARADKVIWLDDFAEGIRRGN